MYFYIKGSILLVEETEGPGENYRPVTGHWQTLSNNVVHSPWSRFELPTSVVIGTDCIGSCKSNYHTTKATTAPLYKSTSYYPLIHTGDHIWLDMSFLSDTLFWFRTNQSLLLLFSVACLAEKQHIPVLQSLVWHDRCSNPRTIMENGKETLYTYWLGMRIVTLVLSPRYQLLSETAPRTIVGTEGTIKVN
jgi:hypothetical protein